jgi:hypothetical protein
MATRSMKTQKPKTLLVSLLSAAARGDEAAGHAAVDLLIENGQEKLLASNRWLASVVKNSQLGGWISVLEVLMDEGLLTETEADEVCPWRSADAAVKAIRKALKERSGKEWSVKRDTGTASGWIDISAPPPRRRTWQRRYLGEDAQGKPMVEWYEDASQEGGSMSPADRDELTRLLGLSRTVDPDGVSIPASSDHRWEYVDRAEGRTPTVHGTQYWD